MTRTEPFTTTIDVTGFTQVRGEALKAHATQVDPNSPFWFGLPPEVMRDIHPVDEFRLAQSRVGPTDVTEDDSSPGCAPRLRPTGPRKLQLMMPALCSSTSDHRRGQDAEQHDRHERLPDAAAAGGAPPDGGPHAAAPGTAGRPSGSGCGTGGRSRRARPRRDAGGRPSTVRARGAVGRLAHDRLEVVEASTPSPPAG